MRRSEDTIRVAAQLIDAGNGADLWAESYQADLTVGDILAIQDDITSQLVNVIADAYGVLARSGLRESKKKEPESLDAYDCVLRAMGYLMVFTSDAHRDARDCLERAVRIDPDYSDAWVWLSWMYQDEYLLNFNPRPDPLGRALQAAQRGVDLDQMNHLAHHVLAVCYFLRWEDDLFLTHAERALAINSNNAASIGDMGIFMVGVGEWDRGAALAQKAMRLNPYHGGILNEVFFKYHYHRREYDKALDDLQKQNTVEMVKYWLWMAAVYGQLDRKSEASEALEKVRELKPSVVTDPREELSKDMHVKEWVEHLIDGLRKAGLDIPPRPA